MMAGIQGVSFTDPYSAEARDIENRRRLAEALQAQGQTPLGPTEQVGGWAIKKSPLEGLAKVGQQMSGAYQEKQADEQQKALGQRYQDDLSRALMTAGQAATGTPASPAPADELGGGPARPAVAPDRQAVIQALMSHPATQGMAMQQMSGDLSRQQLISALGGAQGAPAAGAPGQPGMPQTGAGARTGGPAGGIPMKDWLQVDPTGKEYMQQLAKDQTPINVRPGGTVYTPGKGAEYTAPVGGVQTNMTPQGPVAVPVAGYGAAAAAANAAHPPVRLSLSGGQTAELSGPEYVEFQRTGQLPARYGQTAGAQKLPANVPEADRGAYEAVVSGKVPAAYGNSVSAPQAAPAKTPALGTAGLSQPQEDVIRQAREQAGGKAVDEQFAKDYVSFTTGGAADAAKQISQLGDVQKALAAPDAKLTGQLIGSVPDAVLKFNKTGQNAIAMRERVEEVVQRSLRAILGAQFTEKEGERLIARAYNPNLSESENAIRVGRLATQLQQAYASKQDAAAYYQKNNTLQGWQGKLPSMSDFDPGAQDAAAKVGAPQVSPATREFLKQQGITVD